MEKPLKLKGTEDTPEVSFDRTHNQFCLSGRSLPEDAFGFYRPVTEWMKTYVKSPASFTEFQVKLSYFNSSSVKHILEILLLLEDVLKSGNNATIIWWYSPDDDLMEIKGREFKSMLSVPFELRIY
jgi:hypothetical protein